MYSRCFAQHNWDQRKALKINIVNSMQGHSSVTAAKTRTRTDAFRKKVEYQWWKKYSDHSQDGRTGRDETVIKQNLQEFQVVIHFLELIYTYIYNYLHSFLHTFIFQCLNGSLSTC